METVQVLILESAAGMRDYLAELIEINGCKARTLKEKSAFLTELEQYPPDLVLLGPSNQLGHIKAISEVLEREKSGTPILAIVDGAHAPMEHQAEVRSANVSWLPAGFDSAELKQTVLGLVRDARDPDYQVLEKTIIGKNQAIVELKRHIIRLAKTDVTILITGESGTGKELVARAIHKLSARADEPFIKVNSAALPANLLESELFGFEKGAFTGAYNKKPGKFELAHCGTILLDEIGEIPLPLQSKLLQVLQDSEYAALGSTVNTKIDCRVVAATNKDLTRMVMKGEFREDLYYRLNVVALHVPPLRERREDIGLLCDHFLRRYAQRYSRAYRPLSPWMCDQFCQYTWPGNVRELESFVQSMTVLGHQEGYTEKMGTSCQCTDIPVEGAESVLEPESNRREERQETAVPLTPCSLKEVCREAVRKAETEAIMNVLFHTRWNRRRAADFLEISYKALLNKIKDYGIEERYKTFVKKRDDADELEGEGIA